MRSFVGREVEAITLNVTSETSDEVWTEALTDNYLKLRLKGKHAPNLWLNAKVKRVEDGHLAGAASNTLSNCA
jgi:hypothetical protein